MEEGGLKVVKVYEPRLALDLRKEWPALIGSQSNTQYILPSQSWSNAFINFSVVPPSQNSVLDRKVLLQINGTISAVGTSPSGSNLYQPGTMGFRAHPVQRIISQLNANINGCGFTIEPVYVVNALERSRKQLQFQNTFDSVGPNYTDKYQDASDGFGANNNPLGVYADSSPIPPRGAYPLTITSNTSTTFTANFTIYEYLILPPFLFNGNNDGFLEEQPGLTWLNTLTISATLQQNLARLWQTMPTGNGATGLSDITSMTVSIANSAAPNLILNWLSPRLTQRVPRELIYPYYQIVRYTSQSLPLNSGQSGVISSNTLQFSSIPLKMYIYAKQQERDITASTTSLIQATDTFAAITAISCNFNNISGIFSGANQQHLYQMSLNNGLDMSWPEFIGQTQVPSGSTSGSTKTIGTVGSMLCIVPAIDFPLDDRLSDSVNGNFQFQVTAMQIQNTNQYSNLTYELTVICVYDGTIEIKNNFCVSKIGVVTKRDVLDAPTSKMSYNQLQKLSGGDFFSSLGDVLKNVGQTFANEVVKVPGQLLGHALPALIGLGEDGGIQAGLDAGMSAGRKRGGKKLTQRELARKLGYK